MVRPGMEVGRVCGVAAKQVECVTEEIDDRLPGFASAVGTAGKIQDDAVSANAANSPAQDRVGRVFQALGAHELRDSVDEAIADRASGFRSDVARSDTGTPSGHDEVAIVGELNQVVADDALLIGNNDVLG